MAMERIITVDRTEQEERNLDTQRGIAYVQGGVVDSAMILHRARERMQLFCRKLSYLMSNHPIHYVQICTANCMYIA